MTTIKNYLEIVEALAMLLAYYDKAMHNYQTDVYLYLHDDGTAELDEFVNVGGNSWLDDDHYTIYSDKEHYESIFSYFCNYTISELCEVIGMAESELIKSVSEHNGIDEEESTDWCEIKNYIKDHEELMDKLIAVHSEIIDDNYPDYYHRSEQIIDDFINNLE